MSYITVRIEAMQRELELLKKSLEKPERALKGFGKGLKSQRRI